MYLILPLHSLRRGSYNFVWLLYSWLEGARVGRGYWRIEFDCCVEFCNDSGGEFLLSNLFASWTLRINWCMEVIITIDTMHWRMGVLSSCTAIRGRARMVACCMLLSTYTTSWFFLLAHCCWVAKPAAIATLWAWSKWEIFIQPASTVAYKEVLISERL